MNYLLSSLLVVVVVLVGACTVVNAQNMTAENINGTNATMSSGSGSGSGSGGVFDCSSFSCSHDCNETNEGPICYCPAGYELGVDEMTCQLCRGGYWGPGCNNRCNCSSGGNPCDKSTGRCDCNSCYEGDNCENSRGSDCFTEFLGIADKVLDELLQRYGGDPYPTPHPDTIRGLIANLMETDANIIRNDVELVNVDRRDVTQGPLAKLKWTVDYTVNRPGAEQGLSRLEEKVKLGSIRATLIIQELINTAQVTLNAGTKQE